MNLYVVPASLRISHDTLPAFLSSMLHYPPSLRPAALLARIRRSRPGFESRLCLARAQVRIDCYNPCYNLAKRRSPMATTVKITTIGNSVGIVLPKEVLNRLHVEKGDSLYLTDAPDGVRLSPYKQNCPRSSKRLKQVMRKPRCPEEARRIMDEPIWIDKREALMPREQLAEQAARDGIRDETLLDSALAKPRNVFAYAERQSFDCGVLCLRHCSKSCLHRWQQAHGPCRFRNFSTTETDGIYRLKRRYIFHLSPPRRRKPQRRGTCRLVHTSTPYLYKYASISNHQPRIPEQTRPDRHL